MINRNVQKRKAKMVVCSWSIHILYRYCLLV